MNIDDAIWSANQRIKDLEEILNVVPRWRLFYRRKINFAITVTKEAITYLRYIKNE